MKGNMQEKLNHYLSNFKVKHQGMLSEYIHIRQMINAYESDEKLWKTYTTANARAMGLSLDKIEIRLSQFRNDSSPDLQDILSYADRHCEFEIKGMFFRFLDYRLNILVQQMKNRYRYFLEESSRNQGEHETVNALSENCSEEDSDSGMDDTDYMDIDAIVLSFLSHLILNKHQRFYLPLSMQCPDSNALDFAFIAIVEEHCQLKQKSIDRFRSNFTELEIWVWGMKNKAGEVLDLSNYETTYLWSDAKWSVLAKIYQLTEKKTLILHACITPHFVTNAFVDGCITVNTLVFKDIHMTVDWHVNSFGELLKRLQVKSLDLSNNYLYQQSEDWWKSLSTILTIGKVQQLNLSGNELYQLSDQIWDTFLNDMRDTHLESIKINGNLISFASANPEAEDPNRFFQPETIHDRTPALQPTSSEQCVIS